MTLQDPNGITGPPGTYGVSGIVGGFPANGTVVFTAGGGTSGYLGRINILLKKWNHTASYVFPLLPKRCYVNKKFRWEKMYKVQFSPPYISHERLTRWYSKEAYVVSLLKDEITYSP